MTTLTKKQINWLNKCASGTWSLNPQTGLVDVKGGFYCSKQGLTDFKGVKFGVVELSFSCSDNRLTSLVGAPQKVELSFYCRTNQLTTLEGAPQKVGGDFHCEHNQLTSLVGAPQKVGRDFDCEHNQLTSLEGAPQRVSRDFCCNRNDLTSLEGAPQRVGRDFFCEANQLTSLEGAPQKVKGGFYCYNNRLTSLEGAPLKVGGNLWCDANPVSPKTLVTIFDEMQKGHSFVIAAASLMNKMNKKDCKLISNSLSKKGIAEDKIEAIKSWYNIRNMI
jgi:hypothetical protein